MNGNDFVGWILRSPFHKMMSRVTMLIMVTGKKSGRGYTLPVSYYEDGGCLWIITRRDRTWWKNLQDGGADVNLLVKRTPLRGFASVESDPKATEARLVQYFQRFPRAARAMKVRMENGAPHPEDVARVLKERMFVKVKVAE